MSFNGAMQYGGVFGKIEAQLGLITVRSECFRWRSFTGGKWASLV